MSKVKLFHHASPVGIKLRNGSSVCLADYIADKCPSIVGPQACYHHTPYLYNGHLQTAYAAYYNGTPTMNDVSYER